MSGNMAGSNWQSMQSGPPSNLYQNNQQFRPPPNQNQQGQFPFQNQGQTPFQNQGQVPFQQQQMRGQNQYQNSQVPFHNPAQGFGPRSRFGGRYPGGPGVVRMGPMGPGAGPGPGTGAGSAAGNFSLPRGSPPQQHRQQLPPQMSPQQLRQQQQQVCVCVCVCVRACMCVMFELTCNLHHLEWVQ